MDVQAFFRNYSAIFKTKPIAKLMECTCGALRSGLLN